jgi:hypothetical protein
MSWLWHTTVTLFVSLSGCLHVVTKLHQDPQRPGSHGWCQTLFDPRIHLARAAALRVNILL